MKTKAPKEDPRLKSLREAAERRADADYTENTGQLLDEETRRRIRRFGARSGATRAVTGGSVFTGGGGSGSSGSGGGSTVGGTAGGSAASSGARTAMQL